MIRHFLNPKTDLILTLKLKQSSKKSKIKFICLKIHTYISNGEMMNLQIKSSLKYYLPYQRIGAYIMAIAVPIIAIIIGLLCLLFIKSPDITLVTTPFIFAGVSPIVFIFGFFVEKAVYLTDVELRYKVSISTKRIALQDILGIYTTNPKGKQIIFVRGRKKQVIGFGYGFSEEDKILILSKLKEIAIIKGLEYKENVTLPELMQIFKTR